MGQGCMGVYVQPTTCIFGGMTGVFYVPRGDTGGERTPNESQRIKLTLEKESRPPLPPGFELGTFGLRVLRFTTKLSRLCICTRLGLCRLCKNLK